VTPFCKNRKSVKWYGGIVQNLEEITQILASLCTGQFSLANTKMFRGLIFFWTHGRM